MHISIHRSWLFVLSMWWVSIATYSIPAGAQAPGNSTSDGTPLTLSAALDLALKASPDLAAARRELAATDGTLVQAQARPNPHLSYLLEDTRQATRATTLQINQLVELGAKRAARINAAERGRDIAAAELASRQTEIRALVIAAFFDLLVAQERTSLAQDAVELARRAAAAAAKRVQAGNISPVEEIKARVAESNARMELSQAQSDLITARQSLARTWNDPLPRFSKAVGALDALPELPTLPELQARLTNSPNLRRARLEIERRQALADLERAKRVPDLTLSLGVKRDEQLGRDQAVIGVSVPLPIFDRNRGNLLEALMREDKARDEQVLIENRLTNEALEARQRLSAAHTQAETLGLEVLPVAHSAYEATSKGFQLGKFTFLDVLDAQRTLFHAKSQRLRAVAEAHRAAADIDRLVGDTPRIADGPRGQP